MTLSYDLYWSFRSPYSYLLTPRLVELERNFDVRCDVRPVYPLAVRTPEFFDAQDPLWTRYFMVDIFREAAFRGLPFRWPRPDPVQRGVDGDYRTPQPYIHRLTHLGVAAAERGRGLAFLDEVSRLIWGGAAENWHQGAHLANAAGLAGLDWAEIGPRWTAMPTDTEPSWRRTRPPNAKRATGASRLWCLAASRSSVRTGSSR